MAGVPVIVHRSKIKDRKESQNKKAPQPVLIYFHGGGWEWLTACKTLN